MVPTTSTAEWTCRSDPLRSEELTLNICALVVTTTGAPKGRTHVGLALLRSPSTKFAQIPPTTKRKKQSGPAENLTGVLDLIREPFAARKRPGPQFQWRGTRRGPPGVCCASTAE